MQINSVSDFRAAKRNGAYAWPEGYPLYFVCDDGGTLCAKCARKEARTILHAIMSDARRDQWRVVGADINYEDSELFCDHCSDQIESAYGSD